MHIDKFGEPVNVVVDAGQTGLRLGLASGQRVEVRANEVGGLSYSAGRPAETVLRSIQQALTSLAATPGRARVVSVGLTTVLETSDSDWLARQLLSQLDADRVLLTGDVVTAHAGALDGQSGVVLAAGTGATALAVTAGGRTRQVDGWGYLYGDVGGGFWIGRKGLERAMRGHDGRERAGVLTDRAREIFGDLDSLPGRLYARSDAVAQVASFAHHVLDLAETDPDARTITNAAAAELAGTVVATATLFAPGEAPAISWNGRLLTHPRLRDAFEAELARAWPAGSVTVPVGDGLQGAAHLAATKDNTYEHLVRVTDR